ncbi:MAG: hypothetical protein KDI39_20125, partial [Pseudomonadales bacterium]|nr:hypothetical protein [Pseudomonadales bacterium]
MIASSVMSVEQANAANAMTTVPAATTSTVGAFTILWTGSRLQVKNGTRVIWESVTNESFVRAGTHSLDAHELRGSFDVKENINSQCTDQSITSFTQSGTEVVFKGRLTGNAACTTNYTLSFTQPLTGHLRYKLSFDNASVNYSELAYSSSSSERFHGFGEQFSILDLKGKVVPVLSEEGGVGRGHQPISGAVNLGSAGAAGNELTTYYAVPQYITNTNKSLFLENTQYSVFDLSDANRVRVRLFSNQMTGRILLGNSMLELIQRFTDYTGRMRPLPD